MHTIQLLLWLIIFSFVEVLLSTIDPTRDPWTGLSDNDEVFWDRPEKPWPFQRRQKVFEKVDVFEDLSCIQRSFAKFISCTT